MNPSVSSKSTQPNTSIKRTTTSDSIKKLTNQFSSTKGTITVAHDSSKMKFGNLNANTLVRLENPEVIAGGVSIIRTPSDETDSISSDNSGVSIFHTNSNDSIKSDAAIMGTDSFNFDEATPASKSISTKFGNFVSEAKNKVKKSVNDGFKTIDNLSKKCALMKNELKAKMPNITHSENKQIMPKKLKSVLRGIVSLPYNIAKNTVTIGYKATSSSASLLKKTVDHSYKSNTELNQIKGTLSSNLGKVNEKISEKSEEIDELALVVSDVVTISSQDELKHDGLILKQIYDKVEVEINDIKSDENQSLTHKEIANLTKQKLEENYKNHAGELKGSYHNDNKSNEELTFNEFIESTNFQHRLYFKYADDTENQGCIKSSFLTNKDGEKSFPLNSKEGKMALSNKIKDNLRNKLTKKFKDEFDKKGIPGDKQKDKIEEKLTECLKTVKTCEKWAINNSTDSDTKEIYRQLKNNDTVGLFRDEFYELSDTLDKANEINEEIDIIEDLQNMDSTEKNSYITDKALDVVDNAANSLWSCGFTGSVFGIAPLAALCVVGGGLVMAAKGLKVVNNGMRTAYASHMKQNNLKEAKKLGEEIQSLKDIVLKTGNTLETFINENLQNLEKKLDAAGDNESEIKKALNDFYEKLNTKIDGNENTTIGDVLTEINTKTRELKEVGEAAMKHKRVATEAHREAQFDAINFLTWATFITAAGVAAQVAVEGGNASGEFASFMTSPDKMLAPGVDPMNQLQSGETTAAFMEGSNLSFDSSAAVNATINATAYYADITLGEKIGNVVHGQDSKQINDFISDLNMQETILDDVLKNWKKN